MFAFELSGVRCDYGERTALNIERLEIEPGRVTAVLGPNGSGKTTLLWTLALLRRPQAGRLSVLGAPAWGAGFDPTALRQRIGLVTQRPFLFGGTVRSNLRMALRLRGVPRQEWWKRLWAVMQWVEMVGMGERHVAELSEGQKMRVALARAFVCDPEVYLLDEPMASLDPGIARVVEEMARELIRNGRTVVLATHDPSPALRAGGMLVYLREGRIAPMPLENMFVGEVVGEDGALQFRTSSGFSLAVAEGQRGRATATVDPGVILLSRAPLVSSARNVLRGRITVLEELGRERIRVRLDAGAPFVVHVTSRSVTEMALRPGDEVYLTFKASSVALS